jgi:ABC-type glucose/galactose transport system permease subunit
MIIEVGSAIVAVRFVMDGIKKVFPTMSALGIQVGVLILSIIASVILGFINGKPDITLMVGNIAAIFAGAITFYSVVQKRATNGN